jgi:transposase
VFFLRGLPLLLDICLRKNDQGKWLKNGAAAKSGLNCAILDKGWHQFERFLKYKAERAGKAIFKVSAYQTSQECAACSHTHPDNCISQSSFHCGICLQPQRCQPPLHHRAKQRNFYTG